MKKPFNAKSVLLFFFAIFIACCTPSYNTGLAKTIIYGDTLIDLSNNGQNKQNIDNSYVIFEGNRIIETGVYTNKIEKGYEADILILNQNPIASLENLKDIYILINNGTLIERDRMLFQGRDGNITERKPFDLFSHKELMEKYPAIILLNLEPHGR